jgi:hypothetical protein
MKVGGKQSSQLAEMVDYVGNRKKMEDSKSVQVGLPVRFNHQCPLALRDNQ